MADIKVRIEVNPNAESEMLGDVKNDNAAISNVSLKTNSNNIFQNKPSSKSFGINGLSWGNTFINEKGKEDSYLVFNEQGYVDNPDLQGAVIESEENPIEFVWGIVPESNEYSVKLTFTDAENLKDIVVYGNQKTNQFPTRAIIDGKTEIYSDDYRWAINLLTESNTHTIEFTHWNRSNYNANLTFIAVMMRYWEIDKSKGLKSIESLSQSTGQPKEIFYGVIPSTGSLQIIDLNGDIADMVRDGIINPSNLKLEIISNGNTVANHISNDAEYGTNNYMLNLAVSNKLSNWDKINFKGRRLTNSTNLYELLFEVLTSCEVVEDYPDLDNMLKYKEKSVKTNLQNIILEHPYLNPDSLRATIDKICVLAMLNVIEDSNGNIKFIDARPKLNYNDKIIPIPSKIQMGNINRDIILKNEYKSDDVFVEFEDTKITEYSIFHQNIKFYEYSNITKKRQDYKYCLNKPKLNPNITVLGHTKNAPDNPTSFEGSFWYYDIFKIDFNYDIEDIKILQNYSLKAKLNSYTSIFPDNTIQIDSDGIIINDIKKVDNSITENEIIEELYQLAEKYLPSAILKDNGNGSLTLYVIKLDLITFKNIGLTGVSDDIINRIDVDMDLELFMPRIEATNISTNKDYKLIIKSNELLQNTTYYNNLQIKDYLKQLLVEDYSTGISSAKVSIICNDMYDDNKNIIKDWSKGEILQVGDIVRIDKDNNGNSAVKYADGSDMYFRITGCKFRYSGVPLIDLELQEIKAID